MLPDDAYRIAPIAPFCLDCGADTDGVRWRCELCLAACLKAIERAGPGVAIKPSMIDEERRRGCP